MTKRNYGKYKYICADCGKLRLFSCLDVQDHHHMPHCKVCGGRMWQPASANAMTSYMRTSVARSVVADKNRQAPAITRAMITSGHEYDFRGRSVLATKKSLREPFWKPEPVGVFTAPPGEPQEREPAKYEVRVPQLGKAKRREAAR